MTIYSTPYILQGVELWYTISITRKGGGSADFCYNKLRNKWIAVAITLGVLLVLIYIGIVILYFTKWRRRLGSIYLTYVQD